MKSHCFYESPCHFLTLGPDVFKPNYDSYMQLGMCIERDEYSFHKYNSDNWKRAAWGFLYYVDMCIVIQVSVWCFCLCGQAAVVLLIYNEVEHIGQASPTVEN
jgi:hypothetical protein